MNQLRVFNYVVITVNRQHCPVPRLIVEDQSAMRGLCGFVGVSLQGGSSGFCRGQAAMLPHHPGVATPLGIQQVEVFRFAPCHGSTISGITVFSWVKGGCDGDHGAVDQDLLDEALQGW